MKKFLTVASLAFAGTLMASPSFAADGAKVYASTCAVCHASGVANAPKLGDKAAWAARTGAGVDALVATVVKGKGAMPPKAGNAALADADIKAAVEHMLASVK